MQRNDKTRIFAVRLQDLIDELNLASTFIDLGCSVLSGTSDHQYPPSETLDRGLLMLDAYRASIEAVIGEMKALVKDIDPDS